MKEFEYYCKLIKDMNNIDYKKPNQNAELAYYDKLAQIVKEKNGQIITFKSIVRSVGLRRMDVLDISIYSLYMYFDGIMCNENYNAQVRYSCIPSEKPNRITEYWFTDKSVKKTDLTEEDKKMMDSHMGGVQKKHENGTTKQI
jgi:hypothetical protein